VAVQRHRGPARAVPAVGSAAAAAAALLASVALSILGASTASADPGLTLRDALSGSTQAVSETSSSVTGALPLVSDAKTVESTAPDSPTTTSTTSTDEKADSTSEPVKEAVETVTGVLQPVATSTEPVKQATGVVTTATEPVKQATGVVTAATEPLKQAADTVMATVDPVETALELVEQLSQTAATSNTSTPSIASTEPVVTLVQEASGSLGSVGEAVPGGLGGLVEETVEVFRFAAGGLGDEVPLTDSPIDEGLSPGLAVPTAEPLTDLIATVSDQTAAIVLDVSAAAGAITQPALEPLQGSLAPVLSPIRETLDTVLVDTVDPLLAETLDTLAPVTRILEPVLQPIMEAGSDITGPIVAVIAPSLDSGTGLGETGSGGASQPPVPSGGGTSPAGEQVGDNYGQEPVLPEGGSVVPAQPGAPVLVAGAPPVLIPTFEPSTGTPHPVQIAPLAVTTGAGTFAADPENAATGGRAVPAGAPGRLSPATAAAVDVPVLYQRSETSTGGVGYGISLPAVASIGSAAAIAAGDIDAGVLTGSTVSGGASQALVPLLMTPNSSTTNPDSSSGKKVAYLLLMGLASLAVWRACLLLRDSLQHPTLSFVLVEPPR
jgi:hypothetical protein